MDLNQQKEQFSNAYVRAVAAVAGFTCYQPQPDIDSVDWGIAQVGGTGAVLSPKLELQLKCTSRDVLAGDLLNYPLKIKNYNGLRGEKFQVPRIPVVVVVPDDHREWLCHSEQELAMRHCGYWASLRGKPPIDNRETITVAIPRNQQFTVDALVRMMNSIGEGGSP